MKIGFLISQYGDNELAKTFISSANRFLCDSSGVDIIGFVANQMKPISHPIFATMNLNEAFDYDGIVVATTIDLALKLARFPGPTKRYLYLWELMWTRYGFEELMGLFHNPKLTVVLRTEQHKEIVEKCWNCNVDWVIPDFDIGLFLKMINHKDKNNGKT